MNQEVKTKGIRQMNPIQSGILITAIVGLALYVFRTHTKPRLMQSEAVQLNARYLEKAKEYLEQSQKDLVAPNLPLRKELQKEVIDYEAARAQYRQTQQVYDQRYRTFQDLLIDRGADSQDPQIREAYLIAHESLLALNDANEKMIAEAQKLQTELRNQYKKTLAGE